MTAYLIMVDQLGVFKMIWTKWYIFVNSIIYVSLQPSVLKDLILYAKCALSMHLDI